MNKSIAYTFSKSTQKGEFVFIETPKVALGLNDIEVQVKAISLNPVDYKVASGVTSPDSPAKVLGWDVSGTITKIGTQVKNFKVGDEVYYAGDIKRPGGNTQLHIVDSRIVAKKPTSLSFLEAAALPLTSLTAWEGLFESLGINPNQTAGKSLLVIGGAGGVGSMVIQLAKKLTQLKVIATSSQESSVKWCKELGADEVINYKNGLAQGLQIIGMPEVDYVFCSNDTETYFDQFAEITKPFGRIVSIVEVNKPMNIASLKSKSISFGWELMFTKSIYQTPDMASQGEILRRVADLVDSGKIKTTLSKNLGAMTPASLTEGHKILRKGSQHGKIVLEAII